MFTVGKIKLHKTSYASPRTQEQFRQRTVSPPLATDGPGGETQWFVLTVVRPEIHPHSPPPAVEDKRTEDRPHPSLHLFRGRSLRQRSSGDAHVEHTETSETHNSQHVLPLAALSPQPPMLRRPSPLHRCFSGLQRSSSHSPTRLQLLGPTVPTAAPDQLG